jgi:hypothetical protein
VKQLERRLINLETHARASVTEMEDDEIERVFQFLTFPEMGELARIWGELGVGHPTAREITLRSTTRRERYPLLWEGVHRNRSGHPAIPDPWSIEAEIEALRNDVAINWEPRGLALDLDTLTPDDLTILDHLQPKWTMGLAYWHFVKRIATPSEIEAVLAKVFLVARSNGRDEYGLPMTSNEMTWEDVLRPLTWADLKLDPATFPWAEHREWERLRSSWRRW